MSPINSPSFAAVKRHAFTRFPGAKWVEYSSVHTVATAQPVTPRIAFDKAAVVVALDSDFLGLDSTTVLPVKEFVRGGRKLKDDAPVMNRLYAVEPQFSATGAAADHRFRSEGIGNWRIRYVAAERDSVAGESLEGRGAGQQYGR